jgi:hypothetical protein
MYRRLSSSALSKFKKDFPPVQRPTWNRLVQMTQVSWRLFAISAKSVAKPESIIALAVSGITCYGIGIYEASILCVDPYRDYTFCSTYSLLNVLPAFVWDSVEAENIAYAYGWNPEEILIQFDEKNKEDAMNLLIAQQLAMTRMVVAGFMTIAQILRMVHLTFKSQEKYRKRVQAGKEPFLKNMNMERVIRLAGLYSDCTMLSVERYGQHILPIYEDPDERHLRRTVEKIWERGWVPAWWRVRAEEYGDRNSWRGFVVNPEWCLKTISNKRILVVEVDAINIESSLMFGTPSTDLTVQDAAQAFRMIETLIEDQQIKVDKVLRVYLADSLVPVQTGGGHEYKLKEYVQLTKEADILIDATAPIVADLIKWCFNITKQKGTRKIVFITESTRYFKTLKEMLSLYGYNIVDRADVDFEDLKNHIILFYERTTFATVNSIYTLLKVNAIDPNSCCAIVEKSEGVTLIENMATKEPKGQVFTICSSKIHDDLFREVRVWTRMDFSPSEIQKTLDRRYRPILYHAASHVEKTTVPSAHK